jgi:hypothetical protein
VPHTEDAFRDFVAASSPQLLRAAWLLTGDETTAHVTQGVPLDRPMA